MKFTRFHAVLSHLFSLGVGIAAGGLISRALGVVTPYFAYQLGVGSAVMFVSVWAMVHRRERFHQLKKTARSRGDDGLLWFTEDEMDEIGVIKGQRYAQRLRGRARQGSEPGSVQHG